MSSTPSKEVVKDDVFHHTSLNDLHDALERVVEAVYVLPHMRSEDFDLVFDKLIDKCLTPVLGRRGWSYDNDYYVDYENVDPDTNKITVSFIQCKLNMVVVVWLDERVTYNFTRDDEKHYLEEE